MYRLCRLCQVADYGMDDAGQIVAALNDLEVESLTHFVLLPNEIRLNSQKRARRKKAKTYKEKDELL